MPKDAYYFSHDSNAKDDPKCSMLIEQLGLEGYGIYWVLVETLRDQPEYKYPLAMLPIVARKYNTTAEKVRVVVGNYGLFEITEDQFFLSESLCRRMEAWEETRELKRIAGRKSGAARRLASGVPDEMRSDLPQVYVLKCFGNDEEFIKIGSTNGTISRRFSGNFPYSYVVLRQFFSNECILIERELHENFDGYKYWPDIKFGGDAECYDIKMLDEIMNYSPKAKITNEHCSNSVQTQLELREESKVKKSKVNKIKKSKEEQLTYDYFSDFWEEYPRKTAKADAQKAFAKIKVDDDLMEKIMDALFAAKESEAWVKDGGKFIPYPATWLNGRRWEDGL